MLNKVEQYFSRNLTEVSVHLNEYRRHLLPLGYQHAERTLSSQCNQTTDCQFCIFMYQFSGVTPTWPNQVASTKISVAMAPKLVATGRAGSFVLRCIL